MSCNKVAQAEVPQAHQERAQRGVREARAGEVHARLVWVFGYKFTNYNFKMKPDEIYCQRGVQLEIPSKINDLFRGGIHAGLPEFETRTLRRRTFER